jgi:hypothetical protein
MNKVLVHAASWFKSQKHCAEGKKTSIKNFWFEVYEVLETINLFMMSGWWTMAAGDGGRRMWL